MKIANKSSTGRTAAFSLVVLGAFSLLTLNFSGEACNYKQLWLGRYRQ